MTVPLCVDLDGTLIRTDTLHELLIALIKRNPLWLLVLPFWLMHGRAYFKKQISQRVSLIVETLPYNENLLEHLRHEQARGRTLILVTAADEKMAQAVADYLGIFDEVIASNGSRNLRAHTKHNVLTERFGKNGFDYVGNSKDDLAVWASVRQAWIANATRKIQKRCQSIASVTQIFPREIHNLQSLIKTIRWEKMLLNFLIFLPPVFMYCFMQVKSTSIQWLHFVWGYICLCGITISAYLIREILRLEQIRQKPRRRFSNCLAVGSLTIPYTLAATVLLLSMSIGVAFYLDIFHIAFGPAFVFYCFVMWLFKIHRYQIMRIARYTRYKFGHLIAPSLSIILCGMALLR